MRLLLALLSVAACASALQCVDENNNNVDWYVLYKIPHMKKNSPNKLIKNGDAYMYITSSNVTKWQLSANSVNYTESFFALTLAPLYDQDKSSSLMHILYNDEPPNKSSKSNKGHTKGVVIGDENGGIWMVHSVPLFPPPSTEKYAYPNTGTVFGQSVLCMSFDVENMDKVGTQLKYNQPRIYSNNMPASLAMKYPTLKQVIDGEQIVYAPFYNMLTFKTTNGTEFVSFAKTRQFMKELYDDWVAPALNVDLFVETWLNNQGKLPSDCSKKFSVKNVASIKLDAAKVVFNSSADHSKWAVANSTTSNWICIGDINREEHQKNRGGGTVCLNNQKVANSYRDCISTTEDCNKYHYDVV